MARYCHQLRLPFSVDSDLADGSDVTAAAIFAAILRRLSALAEHGLTEACLPPQHTHRIDGEDEP